MSYVLNCLFSFICFDISYAIHRPAAPSMKLYNDREIPSFAFGTWLGLNGKGGSMTPEHNETEQAVLWALEAGYRHIDTASMYAVEDQVGRAIQRKFSDGLKREELFVTTKLYIDKLAKVSVVPALRESLERLNLEYVDLYLIHAPFGQFTNGSYDYTDYVETWRGMIEARNLGLTKHIGVSNFNESQMARLMANGLEQPAVLQVEVNLNLQQPKLLMYCQKHNITVMGYTPFGSLYYNKAAKDAPPPRVDDPELVAIAQKHNKTVPQIVLKYLTELKVILIPKSLNKYRIEENINIFDIQLSREDLDAMRKYNNGYRTINLDAWIDHPYYPFNLK